MHAQKLKLPPPWEPCQACCDFPVKTDIRGFPKGGSGGQPAVRKRRQILREQTEQHDREIRCCLEDDYWGSSIGETEKFFLGQNSDVEINGLKWSAGSDDTRRADGTGERGEIRNGGRREGGNRVWIGMWYCIDFEFCQSRGCREESSDIRVEVERACEAEEVWMIMRLRFDLAPRTQLALESRVRWREMSSDMCERASASMQ
jgi:hypothetical protein